MRVRMLDDGCSWCFAQDETTEVLKNQSIEIDCDATVFQGLDYSSVVSSFQGAISRAGLADIIDEFAVHVDNSGVVLIAGLSARITWSEEYDEGVTRGYIKLLVEESLQKDAGLRMVRKWVTLNLVKIRCVVEVEHEDIKRMYSVLDGISGLNFPIDMHVDAVTADYNSAQVRMSGSSLIKCSQTDNPSYMTSMWKYMCSSIIQYYIPKMMGKKCKVVSMDIFI